MSTLFLSSLKWELLFDCVTSHCSFNTDLQHWIKYVSRNEKYIRHIVSSDYHGVKIHHYILPKSALTSAHTCVVWITPCRDSNGHDSLVLDAFGARWSWLIAASCVVELRFGAHRVRYPLPTRDSPIKLTKWNRVSLVVYLLRRLENATSTHCSFWTIQDPLFLQSLLSKMSIAY